MDRVLVPEPLMDGVRVEDRVEVEHSVGLRDPEELGVMESEMVPEPEKEGELVRHRVGVMERDTVVDTLLDTEIVREGEGVMLGLMLTEAVTLLLVLWLRVTDPVRDTLLHRLLDSVADTVTLEVDERH
jgi:hypothetical protein